MKVLIGTTNPAKLQYYKEFFDTKEIEILSLKDMNISTSPEETGNSPLENSLIKAAYYSKYNDIVICGDSGLYFRDLAIDSIKQPGLFIRRINGKNLSDEEMIEYYSSLAHDMGGKALAYYNDCTTVYNRGKYYHFTDDGDGIFDFYLVDYQVAPPICGWPIDSISLKIVKDSKDYDQIELKKEAQRQRSKKFLLDSIK